MDESNMELLEKACKNDFNNLLKLYPKIKGSEHFWLVYQAGWSSGALFGAMNEIENKEINQ